MNIGDFLPGADERRAREEQEEKEAARMARGRAAFDRAGGSPMPMHNGMAFATGMVGQGLANHAAAAGQINNAIGQEMQSRVAQAREMRRMEHEKEIARMQMMARKQDQDSALIRSLLNG